MELSGATGHWGEETKLLRIWHAAGTANYHYSNDDNHNNINRDNDHNRNKSISACLVAQKMESEKKDEKFDINKAKKLLEKIIKKK